MSEQPLSQVLEAVLLAAGRPVSVEQMLELFEEQQRPTAEEVAAALAELAERCADRACELREVASGWRLQVRPQFAEVVSRLWQERPSRYSRALLETLALIAYRQPITRGEIEDIRGVTVSTTIMRTLHERNWVRVVGHREVPGRPELLGTTREFLDYFGLKSLDDLPTLAELRDLDDIKVQLEFPGGAAIAASLPAPGSAEPTASREPAAAADTEVVDSDLAGTELADEPAFADQDEGATADPGQPAQVAAPDGQER
jgi:segregation and condensation protein B